MRTTKVIAFSVPPDFEKQITKHAQQEHRTISEYVREAIRRYMAYQQFEDAQKLIAKKIKQRKIKKSDVKDAVAASRSA
jgi:hypothetical protein